MKINSINSQYTQGNNFNTKSRNNNCPSFSGRGAEAFSKFYEGVANRKGYQAFIKKFSHSNNTFTHLLFAESCFLSGFYMINTIRNKKIKKEQKPQMVINDTLTLAVSSAGAYFAEGKINSAVMNASENYFRKNADFYSELGQKAMESNKENLAEKVIDIVSKSDEEITKGAKELADSFGSQIKNIVGEEGNLKAYQITADKLNEVKEAVKNAVVSNKGNAPKAKEAVGQITDELYKSSAARAEAEKTLSGITKLKVLVIFGIIYRFIGPVVITPVANRLSSKWFDKKEESPSASKPEQKTEEKPEPQKEQKVDDKKEEIKK